MKELPFDKSMIEEAQEWADNLGAIKNSITKGKGNYVGRLGELSLAKHIGAGEAQDQSGYDLVFKGKKIEVKTKRRAVPPRESYLVNIAETSKHQSPDIYAFISSQFNTHKKGKYTGLEKLWLCGYKSSEDYFDQATFYSKGDKDPDMPLYKFSASCYVMRIRDLDNVIQL